MFFKFKKRRLQRKFLIPLIVILLSGPTVQNAQSELASSTRYSNICSVYSDDPKGQNLTMESLRSRMQETTELYYWSAWQQQLAREVSNSDHAQHLLELGFQIRSVRGIQKMVPPENLLVPIEIYNHSILEMIEAGQLQSSEAIFAVLLFESVQGGGEIKTFRPGIDRLPSAHQWRISKERRTIPHSHWAAFVADGFMPVTLGSQYYIHDLAHITENLRIDPRTQRPEFMIAVRTAYKEQKKEFDKGLEQDLAEVLERRSFHTLEFISLGRQDSEAKLRTLRPELFDNQTSLETLQQGLQELSFEELDVRVKYWMENKDQFVLKQGGGARDMLQDATVRGDFYLLITTLPMRENSMAASMAYRENLADYLRNAKLLLDYILRTKEVLDIWAGDKRHINFITNAYIRNYIQSKKGYRIRRKIDSLLFLRMIFDINRERLNVVKRQIVNQLARFEMGLVKSVELQITPSQLVYDLAGARVRSDSPSIEWLRSHLDPSGEKYSLFIE